MLEQLSGQTGEEHEQKLIGLSPVCVCVHVYICVSHFAALPRGQMGAEGISTGCFSGTAA